MGISPVNTLTALTLFAADDGGGIAPQLAALKRSLRLGATTNSGGDGDDNDGDDDARW